MKIKDEDLQKIVEKIAFEQYAEKPLDDLVAKMEILKEWMEKQFAISDVVEQSEQLKCQCKKAQFTRTVDADFNPLCGRCRKAL